MCDKGKRQQYGQRHRRYGSDTVSVVDGILPRKIYCDINIIEIHIAHDIVHAGDTSITIRYNDILCTPVYIYIKNLN